MNKKPIILGIESSCDETAASIITENEQGMPTILSSIVSSQVDVHKEFGGVVPELAARSHMEKIDLITKKALDESGVKMEDLDASSITKSKSTNWMCRRLLMCSQRRKRSCFRSVLGILIAHSIIRSC